VWFTKPRFGTIVAIEISCLEAILGSQAAFGIDRLSGLERASGRTRLALGGGCLPGGLAPEWHAARADR
jgi:hypothetical protein